MEAEINVPDFSNHVVCLNPAQNWRISISCRLEAVIISRDFNWFTSKRFLYACSVLYWHVKQPNNPCTENPVSLCETERMHIAYIMTGALARGAETTAGRLNYSKYSMYYTRESERDEGWAVSCSWNLNERPCPYRMTHASPLVTTPFRGGWNYALFYWHIENIFPEIWS